MTPGMLMLIGGVMFAGGMIVYLALAVVTVVLQKLDRPWWSIICGALGFTALLVCNIGWPVLVGGFVWQIVKLAGGVQ